MLIRRAVLRLPRSCNNNDVTRWKSTSEVLVNDKKVVFESGHIARLADGAAVVSQGDTAILATVMSKNTTTEGDFLPLTVDFQQSASAVGRIPTNYLRRELQQSDADILASRLIDRSIRPLFPRNYFGDTQVICKPLALDDDGDAVILGMNAASAALAVSDVPWDGPMASVRAALVDNQIVLNPSRQALKSSALDLVLAGCDNGRRILMIDMDGEEINTDKFIECTKAALQAVDRLTGAINALKKLCGKEKRKSLETETDIDLDAIRKEVESESHEKLVAVLADSNHDKLSRDHAVSAIGDEIVEKLKEKCSPHRIRHFFTNTVKKMVREVLFQKNKRCDGRALDEIRPIDITVDVHKKLHGSALFQRGQTQVLSTVTFDAPSAAFRPDYLSQILGSQEKKMFMLHYQFPQFASSALSTSRRTTRRELGHGALAEKALKRLIPAEFPYCIRLTCEVLESNGSSSMASVCGGSLALLDSGVRLKAPAAGVAIGLMTSEDGSEKRILTDINGLEDYTGDMDFKIAGTRHGFTAMQLDVKIPGIDERLLTDSLLRARSALDSVLTIMRKVQKKWRTTFKDNVPVFETIPIAIYQRHILFRSGGFNAKLIESETGAKISLEDEASLSIFAPNKDKLEETKNLLNQIFETEKDVDLTFGAMYKGEIVEILEYGVMVKLQKGMKPILLKNSNLDTRNVAHPQVLGFKVGQKIIVQYLGRDPVTGHHRISRKTLQTTSFPVQSLDRQL